MKYKVLIFKLLFGFTLVGCNTSSNKTKIEQTVNKEVYQCPMDCENGKTYDKPGKCPHCEMELEKKQ